MVWLLITTVFRPGNKNLRHPFTSTYVCATYAWMIRDDGRARTPFHHYMGSRESSSSCWVYVADTFTHQAVFPPLPSAVFTSAWWFYALPSLSQATSWFDIDQVPTFASATATFSDSGLCVVDVWHQKGITKELRKGPSVRPRHLDRNLRERVLCL